MRRDVLQCPAGASTARRADAAGVVAVPGERVRRCRRRPEVLEVTETLGLGGERQVLVRLRVHPLDLRQAEPQQLGLAGQLGGVLLEVGQLGADGLTPDHSARYRGEHGGAPGRRRRPVRRAGGEVRAAAPGRPDRAP